MQIINASKEICKQLFQLCDKLDNKEYAHCSSLLMGSSIGKHMRHIIEFYDLLREGSEIGEVNYDTRVRNVQIETEFEAAKDRLASILSWLDELTVNKNMSVYFQFNMENDTLKQVRSNLMRELAYNLEHAIHHMALMRIALDQQFSHINIDPNFGLAYSTIRYNKNQCAR
ncbi:DinB family protein [Ancylomarina sp. YFZ004]